MNDQEHLRVPPTASFQYAITTLVHVDVPSEMRVQAPYNDLEICGEGVPGPCNVPANFGPVKLSEFWAVRIGD